VFVLLVTCLILFIYGSFWITVAFPWIWWGSTIGFINIILITLQLILIFWNYFTACFTSPGFVPKGWVPDATEEELTAAKKKEVDIHSKDKVIYCHKCNAFKPKRAHHCRQCDKCILKMDHHCPWINNCVGHYNHKSFFLFLTYASSGLTHVFVLFFWRMFEIIVDAAKKDSKEEEMPLAQVIILAMNWSFAFPVTLGIMYIWFHQIHSILQNTTPIETSVRKWQEFDARKAKQPYTWIFDYGMKGNLKAVLGSSWILWPCPTNAESDGIHWKAHQFEEIRIE